MEKEPIEKITLKPVRCVRTSKENPYIKGLVMKRGLTTREACYIYRHILLFNIDLVLDDYGNSKEEKRDYYKDITEELCSYIKGDTDWGSLCETTYCYDEDGIGVSVGAHLKLVEFLQKRNII